MSRHYDLIYLTLSRFDADISSTSISLAKEFAKKNRVFCIDHPYTWKDYLAGKKTLAIQKRKPALLRGKDIYYYPSPVLRNLKVVTPKLMMPVNFMPQGFLYNTLSAWNDSSYWNLVRRIIRENNIKDFIYINFFDPFYGRKVPKDIKPFKTVYQSVDDISQVEYTGKHGTRLEEEIIKNFDCTLCTSRELTRLKSKISGNVFYHPNAADINIFEKAATELLPRPAELKDIDRKIIGYTGSIEYRTDFSLLRKIAEYHHDKILFLVGPVSGDEHIQHGLTNMSNVIFAGPRKLTELPPFLQYFDCVIIPFRKNVLTKSIYPLKINEYLATGKPVISTNFSEDIFSFRDVAYVTDTHEEFIQSIDTAIKEDSEEKKQSRVAVARKNTWEARVEAFWNIVG